MNKHVRFEVLTLLLVVLATCRVLAQTVPNFTSYQGRLTDATGQAVPDNTYQVQFKLYTVETAGTAFTTSSAKNVQTHGGLFTTEIAPVTPGDLSGKAEVWLETWMALPPAPLQALSPRVKLASVPFALVVPWSGVVGAPSALPPSGSAGGDLAGTYPDPSIKDGSVTSAMITDGTIVNADISPSAAISDSKIAGSGVVVTNLNADKLDGLNASDIVASPIKRVVRGTISFSYANYDVTQSFSPAVDPAKCIVCLTGPVNTNPNNQQLYDLKASLMSLTSSQIRIVADRVGDALQTLSVGYQIVEYN